MEVPRREPGNQTCPLFPHPCTILVPRLPPGNARHPRLRLGFQAEPVNHRGSQAGAGEPDMSAFSPPVHHSRSQAPAWERTAPEAPPRFSGGACKSWRFPGGSRGTRQIGRLGAVQLGPLGYGELDRFNGGVARLTERPRHRLGLTLAIDGAATKGVFSGRQAGQEGGPMGVREP